MNFKIRDIILALFLILLFGCKTTTPVSFQQSAPFQIEAPYYERWTAGVRGGGSGINVFLSLENLNGITPDSIHFRGQRVKAVYDDRYIIGRFLTPYNRHQDIILSHEPLAEVNNQLLPKGHTSPFELDDNTCVLSYIRQKKRYYYKIKNLKKRSAVPPPSAPPSFSKP
jgi:hypothetical protein